MLCPVCSMVGRTAVRPSPPIVQCCCNFGEFSGKSKNKMDVSFSLVQLGLGFLIVTVAFGFSVKAASRYSHSGIALLCASLGIEALSILLSFLVVALDPGKYSFLLWASSVLRYVGLVLLLAGWILLAVSSKSVTAREPSDVPTTPPMISGANFVRWGILGILVVSVLAAAWALLMIFAAGMKTVPHLTSQEELSAALPSLVLLPGSIGLSILSVRWAVGRVFVGLAVLSCVINVACSLLAAISYSSP
jgi:hypothetical protein